MSINIGIIVDKFRKLCYSYTEQMFCMVFREGHRVQKAYICIDLKSFYASVECVDRGLDPLDTNLVVADISRTEKTICLAVTPSLKAHGIPGRARLFEVVEKVKEINRERRMKAPGRLLEGKSWFAHELSASPWLELDYITAPPRMNRYMEVSTEIYGIYLRFVAPEDIHVYSVDEVFIDATHYLKTYKMSAREFAVKMIHEVLGETGITATAGVGTNMYLAKIAMDIVAKHIEADKDGVRIAELDEQSYREKLWAHKPLTDFWRIGGGYASRLAEVGIYTMGDIAECSLGGECDSHNAELLYKLFGINAELLIDHAWGVETCTMADIKAYKPENRSLSSGQVLKEPYTFEKARLVIREMAQVLALDLLEKGVVTNQMTVTVGYNVFQNGYGGETERDRYGRAAPKGAHGSANLSRRTSSSRIIADAVVSLFEKITDRGLLIRRLTIAANNVISERAAAREAAYEQLDFFTDAAELEKREKAENERLQRERSIQKTVLVIKQRFGKNAILRGTNFLDGATMRERNGQVGGHKA